MTVERRVLAVPSTEDPTHAINHRAKLESEYMEKALTVLDATLKIEDEPKLRFSAAQWIMEMVMGKPKQALEHEGAVEAEMARVLGSALAHLQSTPAALPPSNSDGVIVLGEIISDTNDNPVIDYVQADPDGPRRRAMWDDLPE